MPALPLGLAAAAAVGWVATLVVMWILASQSTGRQPQPEHAPPVAPTSSGTPVDPIVSSSDTRVSTSPGVNTLSAPALPSALPAETAENAHDQQPSAFQSPNAPATDTAADQSPGRDEEVSSDVSSDVSSETPRKAEDVHTAPTDSKAPAGEKAEADANWPLAEPLQTGSHTEPGKKPDLAQQPDPQLLPRKPKRGRSTRARSRRTANCAAPIVVVVEIWTCKQKAGACRARFRHAIDRVAC